MSFYNMINGCTPAVFFLVPMLGDEHPDDYPRFRDCFTSDEEHPEYDNHIHIYTRVGGNNRSQGYGEDKLYQHPDYVTTWDDSFDNTFGTYCFKVPEKWKTDFDLFVSGNLAGVSEEYQRQVRKVFPKLREKLNTLWPGTAEATP